VKIYFGLLAKRLAVRGYEPQRLIETVWSGTKAMVLNDGSRSNEEVFWKSFTDAFGPESIKDKSYIDEFYAGDFIQAKAACGYRADAKVIVELVKEKGWMAVLATNPIFPAVATENRMSWTGLCPEDFTLYTTYENSCHSKPNPQYYLDILTRIGCEPEECVMIGNDVDEDMIAETLGLKVFLLTDCLINKSGQDIEKYPHGSFGELRTYLMNLE